MQRLLVLLVALAQLSLLPLAHATPPDETWHPGLYDDGDFDDVVLAITSAFGLVDATCHVELQPLRVVVGRVTVVEHGPAPDTRLDPQHERAPPPLASLPRDSAAA